MFLRLTLVMVLLLHYSVKLTSLLLAIGPILKVVAAAVVERSGLATTISKKGKKNCCEKDKSLYNEHKFVKCPNGYNDQRKLSKYYVDIINPYIEKYFGQTL